LQQAKHRLFAAPFSAGLAYAGHFHARSFAMQFSEAKQRIDRVEQCADEAEQSIQQSASVPGELRQRIDEMHQRARQAQQAAKSQQQQQGDASSLKDVVKQIEQAGDRAMQACRNAGSVDQRVQQAVQRAHEEASQLKKQIQMG
jgi:uncharacterized coiled-coil DUF342 family protein